jgi:hypothetical protein
MRRHEFAHPALSEPQLCARSTFGPLVPPGNICYEIAGMGLGLRVLHDYRGLVGRRAFIRAGLACVASAVFPAFPALADDDTWNGYSGITDTSGDPRLDQTLGFMLVDLTQRYGIRPSFAFFDDSKDLNAFAMPATRVSNTRGTVMFGRYLLARSMKDPNGDMLVMAICAHECGHIVQEFSSYYIRLTKGQPTSKSLELHADYQSGHYIGIRGENYAPEQLISLGRGWASLGDTQYTNPQHHGTPEERLEAIEAGFKLARDQPSLTVPQICEAGAVYLGA